MPVETNSGAISDVGERAVALVMVQEVPDAVIGDIEVRLAVVVNVADGKTETFSGGVGNAGGL